MKTLHIPSTNSIHEEFNARNKKLIETNSLPNQTQLETL